MKTGRNELCPCGSGAKYKKCCLSVDENAPSKNPSAIKNYASYLKGESSGSYTKDADEPERYLGYDTGPAEGEDASSHSVDGLRCMVTNITKKTQKDAQIISGKELKIGSWVVTNRSPASKTLAIDGPFETMQDAYDFGREKYSVVRYKAMHL